MPRLKKLATYEAQIKAAYESDQHVTLDELARKHDCSKGTIRNCLINQGVTMRSKGRRKGSIIKKETNNGVFQQSVQSDSDGCKDSIS